MRQLKQQLAFLLLNLIALRWLLSLLRTAESSIWWTTGTTGDGTTTYTESQLTTFFGDVFAPNSTITSPNGTYGVLPGAGGELAVTGTTSPVSVASGAAIAEGFAYRNTAAVTVAIPTPVSNTRIDRIVLRVSHSTTRTVRITRIAGVEGAGSPPAITQTAGTTFDIKLAQVSITTFGVITVTDERSFCHFATRLDKTAVDGMTAGYIPFGDAAGRLKEDTSGGPFYDDTNNRLGLGTAAPSFQEHISGAGQATPNVTDAGNRGATLFLDDTGTSADNGGAAYFGAGGKFWGAIKGLIFDLTSQSTGDIIVALRAAAANTNLAEMFRFKRTGQLVITPPSAVAPVVLGANGQNQKVTGLEADRLDGQDLQTGTATWSGASSSINGSVAVTFGTAFASAPRVTAIAVNALGNVTVTVSSLTASGVTIVWSTAPSQIGAGSITFYWFAFGTI